jgi:hypothetical protein
MILRCRCVSKFQDGLYGESMRVHNKTRKSDGAMQRCTVCKDEKHASPAPSKVDKKQEKKSKESSGKKRK